MIARALTIAALLASALAFWTPGVAAEEVDLELVLAADGSGSIDADELALQRKGYADALTSPEVQRAIRSGVIGKIAVAYIEWGGPASQHVIVDWQVIGDPAAAADFAAKLIARPRAAFGYNSISNAIDFSVRMIETNAIDGRQKVVDVSADGPNIGGRDIQAARDDAVAKGVTINGLVIARPGGQIRRVAGEPLTEHFRRDVIGGPGAFIVTVDETTSFPEAVRRKLVMEIADGLARGRTRFATAD
ncbi:DUF1194 domain-containing protein [Prosthecodimorpha hirschii]|uniref:DUF1194 domain-containing protein n=1 Tax=Prosthecodimorpha hirschii TaxID=665126 RepID=UPI001FEED183|nr:DUF1194 domain-containing protein [Prosthecomicrobium hirschii]